jgi:ribosome-associated protein
MSDDNATNGDLPGDDDNESAPIVEAPVPDESRTLAFVAARAADDKQGVDTLVLSVGNVLAITELFVVTSAANRRLVRTIADEVEEQVREQLGRSPIRVEGVGEREWVLIDFGDVVVHVFADETRRFYNIERLYSDVPTLDWRPDTDG